MRILFIDTETTGLDHERHEVWEFAAIEYDSENLDKNEPVDTHHLLMRPDWLHLAEPAAIRVNHFYERTADLWGGGDTRLVCDGSAWSEPTLAARHIARLCEDALIVGNNPAFDEVMLAKFCKSRGHVLAAFHRKINVVDLALGHLRARVLLGNETPDTLTVALEATRLPHSSGKVLDAAGCPKNKGKHTAMGDAEHVRDAFFHLWGEA